MDIRQYEVFVKDNSFFPPDQGLVYSGLAFAGEAGEVANEIKKLIRDDHNVLTQERRDKIVSELGDCLWYMTSLCRLINSSVEEVMQHNVEKLTARRAEQGRTSVASGSAQGH